MKDIVSYYQNILNQKLLRKAFHILKPLQNNKEERYQQMKKCFEGLRMYTKQKQLLKKYLTEYDKIGYYPETVEDREQFNRIRNGRWCLLFLSFLLIAEDLLQIVSRLMSICLEAADEQSVEGDWDFLFLIPVTEFRLPFCPLLLIHGRLG